jgi:hypothetical protein
MALHNAIRLGGSYVAIVAVSYFFSYLVLMHFYTVCQQSQRQELALPRLLHLAAMQTAVVSVAVQLTTTLAQDSFAVSLLLVPCLIVLGALLTLAYLRVLETSQ